MKDIFVESLTPETGQFDSFFQVRQADRKEKKDGAPYLNLKLGDRTGEVEAKLWDIPEGFTCKTGDFVKVRAKTGTYKDALQVTVVMVRTVDRADVAIEDFIPASKNDRDEMLQILLHGVHSNIIDEGLRGAVERLIEDHRDQLRDAPAARKMHQAYLGGLLEHVLNLCNLAVAVCQVYPELNRDVLIAGMIVHDIGKLAEYRYDDCIGTTRQGHLLGHIIQGSILWHKYREGVEQTLADHVAHIIASHHGQKPWGAAVIPATREAQVAHLLDMIDSRMAIINESLAAQTVDGDGFTGRIHALDTALWNGVASGD